jgi:hypothetical protein
VYNGSDLAGPFVGIHETHTGQIDSYNSSNLAKFVQINLALDLIFTVSSHTTQAGDTSQPVHTTKASNTSPQ